MTVTYSRGFIKGVLTLPQNVREMLDVSLIVLKRDPFYPTLHTKKLKGEYAQLFSFRVSRDWRVLFHFVEDDHIVLLRVGHRKDIYR